MQFKENRYTIVPLAVFACPRITEETELSAAQGCKFCPTEQNSLSGRMTADNETLFTVKGKENFKGVAHMLLIGGMITGKENWIERQGTRILFPGLPLKHYTHAVQSALPPWAGWPRGNSAVVLEGELPQREGIRAKWLFSGDH